MPTENDDLDKLISDLAEHIAVDLLAEFKEEDYIHLEHAFTKLIRAEMHLNSKGLILPTAVKQVLANYRRLVN